MNYINQVLTHEQIQILMLSQIMLALKVVEGMIEELIQFIEREEK